MTCSHVLDLIDLINFTNAEGLVNRPPARLEAVLRHASECATCGPALAAARAIAADLGALPLPSPPPGMAATVMSRIAAIEAASEQAATEREPAGRRETVSDWSPWAALGSLAAGVAVAASGPGMPVGVASASASSLSAGPMALPGAPTGALVLAVGVGLYVAALFVPISSARRRSGPGS